MRGADTGRIARRPSPWRRIVALAVAVAALAAPVTAAHAADPDTRVNVALASGENAPTTEVSYVTGWNSAAALNNGATAATNDYRQMWGTWGDPSGPTQDIATYTWEKPVTVSSSTLFLWQNHLTGDSGVMIPSGWKIEYLDGSGAWAPVGGASLSYPLPTLDTAAPVSSLPPVQADFDAVTTTAVRLVLDRALVSGERKATSVIEWQVWGVDAPDTGPEPGDGHAYLAAEDVAVRTTTGTAPQLPAEAWVIGENGPLAYVPVAWATPEASAYAAPGSFSVAGTAEGYPDQPLTARVFVADTLSDAVTAIDYSSTITTPGVAPVLPRTVRAHYDDGTVSSGVDVRWSAVDPSEYASADAVFDVAGAVTGYAPGAVATVFVVEPAGQGAPVVSIGLDAAPQGSGWYTTAPTVTLTAEPADSPIATVEYTLDGTTWNAYTAPFVVDAQGAVDLRARATAEDGATGEAVQSLKVDTVAPVTGVDFTVVDGTSARVTLTPTDAEPGSGTTRTVWSDGPDPSPTGATNNMFATYEAPFSVQLTDEPRYVHVQTQDAAGNVEAYVTVVLPVRAPVALPIAATATTRCVAGKAQLVVTVRSDAETTAVVDLTTPFGSKQLTVGAGRGVSASFATREAVLPAGSVQVDGSAGERRYQGTAEYAAVTCG